MLPTYDFETEADAIKRKQAIADAMQASALRPLDMPQQPGVKLSGLSVLAKMLEGYTAGKRQEALKTERSELAKRYGDELRSGMESYYKTLEGYEEPSMALAPNADGSPQMAKVPGNRRKAIFDALASNHPVLRDLAMSQLKEQQKPAELKEVGGVVYDPATREIVSLGGPRPTQKEFGGDLYELNPSTGQWKKLDNAAKVTTNLSVGGPVVQGQKAGMAEYFKGAAAQVQALGERARSASDIKQTLAEMKNLDAQGIFSNVTTGPATFLNNLGQVAGVKVDSTKLGNTEAYNALATDLWQGLVSKFGGNRGVTKEESEQIRKMLPLAANSPQARQQLFSILNNVADRQIVQFQNANKTFARSALQEDPTIFAEGFGETYLPEPQAPQTVTPAAGTGGQRKVLKWGDLK